MSRSCVCSSVELAKLKCTVVLSVGYCVLRSNAYTNVIFDEKDLSKDSEKDKMLMESS